MRVYSDCNTRFNSNQLGYHKAKVTPDQQKKHVTQMTNEEIQYIQQSIESLTLNNMKFAKHFFDKNLGVSTKEVKEIIKSQQYRIIEYNRTPIRIENRHDNRVLLRTTVSKRVTHSHSNAVKPSIVELCIVVSITNNTVVTGYYNSVTDKHFSLNWDRYCKTLQILNA